MPTLTQTNPQWKQALDRGNEIRSRRAQLKRDIAQAPALLSLVLLDPPEYAEGAKVHDLLTSLEGIGDHKADKLMRRVCPYSEMRSKTVGSLSDRQRRELIAALDA